MPHPNGLPPMHNPDGTPVQSAKRKQVKNACTNCQKACKKCDDARPCPRCIKYGIADTCVNSVRKERKKGIKRGPYKRRQKSDGEKPTRKNTSGVADEQYMRNPAPMPAYGFPIGGQYPQPSDPTGYPYYYGKDQVNVQYPAMYNPSMYHPVLMQGENAHQPSHHAYPPSALPPHYGNMVQPHTSSPTSSHATPPTSSAAHHQHLSPEPKAEAMTPVPSASTSSGTSSSPAGSHPEEEPSSRLAQLASLSADALTSQDRHPSTPQH
ncbi:hypothetical protein DM01DRAFT_1338451 [Hesseltinella vesiculosa]|uniref:Zn(2)-C6 fungal-type domain-containing protein n=1 Tax=Hesseltinella vesiculosa TaxID=101127 RepID=A0A1X2GB36_9FUNG|nr:hypothetical protein DM01DRAFT_1338451 [Hesseltinella vesiculosa]